MFNISPAPAALAKRASKALSSAKLMFSRCRPPLGLDLSALSPPRSYAICARFTVLSEAPIASAIAGCVIPPSRSSTIWMRWRRFGSPFQRSAVFNRRTWALVHLTISSPESDDQRESQAGSLAKGSNSRTPAQKRRFNQLWSRYKKGATSYVTHFVFHPLSSIDVPGAGKATSLEEMGRHLGNGVSFSFGVSPTMTAPLPFRIGILAVRGL